MGSYMHRAVVRNCRAGPSLHLLGGLIGTNSRAAGQRGYAGSSHLGWVYSMPPPSPAAIGPRELLLELAPPPDALAASDLGTMRSSRALHTSSICVERLTVRVTPPRVHELHSQTACGRIDPETVACLCNECLQARHVAHAS